MTTPEVHVHVHVDTGHSDELRGLIVATKEEVLAALQTLQDTMTELSSDVARLAEDLAAAVQANDLTAVQEKVAALQTLASAIDEAVEAASPEGEPEPEPEPENPPTP
jgi:hypothetical protein